jgi:hypothetical protein
MSKDHAMFPATQRVNNHPKSGSYVIAMAMRMAAKRLYEHRSRAASGSPIG